MLVPMAYLLFPLKRPEALIRATEIDPGEALAWLGGAGRELLAHQYGEPLPARSTPSASSTTNPLRT
jgi:hypothetical protein